MVDVSRWLAEQGLEQYTTAFAENAIDGEVLRTLSEDDLKELGVKALGHRKKLLAAISLLSEELAPERVAEDNRRRRVEPPRVPERRQLTVMFIDLVGSTELSARLDPEDMGTVIRAYQDCCAEVVEHWDGHVAKYMGDGVLVYFGYPQAHEDEAERAVSAGLAIIDALERLETPAGRTLVARVGIATGLVMVGELIGVGAAQEETVVGESPNLAARLQGLAEPGTVVVSRRTRRLIGDLFELTDLGPQRLKGFAEPLTAWRVEGKGRAEGRFEARHGARLTPLVGRDEEIALLFRRWRQATEEGGQVLLVSGEPGIGKSRLVRELRMRLEGEPHVRLLYQCSPHHTTSPLHPQIEQLERAAGFERDDPPEVKLDKLEALLAMGTDELDQAVPLIAAVLGIPTDGRYESPDLSPQRQKQLMLVALVEQLEGLAAKQPVLLAYEDVHWIDPTTQELLGLTIERIQRLPVLAIITFRPEFSSPWSGQPHMSALALTRLGRRDGAALVDRMIGAKSLPAEVSAQIVGKTDGVPLFVEELTKAVLESGLLKDAGDHWELSGPLPPLAIPSTLHDSLLARLDRLAPVKEVAQIGAAIGREFPHALLAAVADRPEDQLRGALDQLAASELIFRRGDPPDATYSFKHALVQDAAYGTLVKSRRQLLHARIAHVLEERFADESEGQPDLIAHHYTEAGLAEKAVEYWCMAGQRAIERSATAEAVTHLTRGLEALGALPEMLGRKEREIRLRSALGVALVTAKGLASVEVENSYLRAKELCEEIGEQAELFAALWGLWRVYFGRAEMRKVKELAQQLLNVARGQEEQGLLLQAHHALWSTLIFSGELTLAMEHMDAGHALYRRQEHHSQAFLYGGHDPGACCRNMRAWCLWLLGYPDQALEWSDEALTLATQLPDPQTLAHTLCWNAPLHHLLRDRRMVEKRAVALGALATEQAFVSYLADVDVLLGWVLAEKGQQEQGIARMRQGLAARQAPSTGTMYIQPYLTSLLALACAARGEASEALHLLVEALERVNQTEERWFEAELHRLQGEALLRLQQTDPAQVENCFRRAIAVAQGQLAKSLELRGATSLARLWRDLGKRAEAHDLLASVYGWFTEGFETADLKEAKALLDELT